MIGIGMASYEKWYTSEKEDSVIKQVLQSLWKGREYLQVRSYMYILRYSHAMMAYCTLYLLTLPQNPVHMGLKLDSLTNECSVHFVKAFWSLMEQDAVKVTM